MWENDGCSKLKFSELLKFWKKWESEEREGNNCR